MLEAVRSLQRDLAQLDRRFAIAKGVQVGPGANRDAARALVDDYFRNFRENVRVSIGSDLLLPCDQQMQALLEATQHKTTVKLYREALKRIRNVLRELETAAVVNGAVGSKAITLDQTDQKIIDTLRKIVPSAALSYEQAALDLQQSSRLSWRGPATDMREALRECLDHLAPDDAVTGQVGFKPEPGANGPTMKQKVRFILKSRGITKTASQTPEAAADAVDEAVGTFVRSVYTRSNVSTHTPTDKTEVLRVRDWIRVAFCELLEIT